MKLVAPKLPEARFRWIGSDSARRGGKHLQGSKDLSSGSLRDVMVIDVDGRQEVSCG